MSSGLLFHDSVTAYKKWYIHIICWFVLWLFLQQLKKHPARITWCFRTVAKLERMTKLKENFPFCKWLNKKIEIVACGRSYLKYANMSGNRLVSSWVSVLILNQSETLRVNSLAFSAKAASPGTGYCASATSGKYSLRSSLLWIVLPILSQHVATMKKQ